jgi:hypothetical protein
MTTLINYLKQNSKIYLILLYNIILSQSKSETIIFSFFFFGGGGGGRGAKTNF